MNPHDGAESVGGLHPGVPYAYSATTPPGARMVFLAGACPLDRDGATTAVGDVVEQTAACLENMTLALEASGARIEDVVFVRALVATSSRDDLADVWSGVRAFFGTPTPPGTLQGVTVLGWPDQLVEIEAVAAVVPAAATVGSVG